MKQFFYGIDGGGTKTEAVLCDESGHVLHRHLEVSTNPNDVGIGLSLARLCRLLQEAHRVAEEESDDSDSLRLHVFAGIAGALNHRDALLGGLSQAFPQDRFWVNSDAINLLSSELAEGDGCCLICGTGSVCFVRRGEQFIRIGGWGYLLDSSGSGYAMGREALEAALRSHDGRGDATLLTSAVAEQLGGMPWDKLTEIYEGGKPFIASFAPCVLQCVAQGDMVAFEILSRQARYLADCLRAAYETIGMWETPLETVLGGGIFGASPELVSLIRQNADIPLRLTVASAPPVFGAVWEAVRQHGEMSALAGYESFKANFLKSYASF